ncbi:CRISPR system precrRNA processing endoribonuclease RAMP protein Cas6 [Heliorestis acidaminivorans]|uniref:CRISPR system precrRNA processing endoribonuclease RAMP protein Cas6 n=1 Tax=Heliorestis acidaminivorans TaxID=553427 RepID=A0A6I0EZ78_9FIRM|nr:CRISPR system precrRNA processing endoribonuclease RAMP protein Cas6 [Heliorestis acidaminivorans]KAB2952702.1 CRISPR system precrRNA processing endoribonuclease RAMP protein Cas6 [Heliorestis acidaminivorans]
MAILTISPFPHPDLKLQRFRIVISAGANGLLLPPYPGSTLRGAFGHALREMSCTAGKGQDCNGCFYQMICPVTMLFNPVVPEEQEGLFAKGQEIPTPFVLRPLTDGRTMYQPGETFEVEITIFGKSIPFAPYLLSALSRALEKGIGKGLKSSSIISAYLFNPFTNDRHAIFEKGQWNLTNKVNLSAYDVDARVNKLLYSSVNKGSQTYKVTFNSPLRLKADKHFQNKLTAPLLIRGLMRRLSVITAYYGEQQWSIDFYKYIELANSLQVREEKYEWVDWERYSSRQNSKMKLGGIMGSLVLEGEALKELLPLLIWGQLIHLGKAASFGLGALEIE